MSDDVTRMLAEAEVRPVLTRPRESHARAWLAALLLLVYGAVVLVATLSPTPLDLGYEQTIAKFLAVLHRNGVPAWFGYRQLEFAANVAMFVPLGFLYGLAMPRRVTWLAFLLVPATSVAIELAQGAFLSERFASLLDIVANTFGGFVGVVLALGLRAIARARERRLIERALWDAKYAPAQR